MKTNNNKGFTLIELIMVIVILGILSAVAVPKFFSMTDQAHTKNKAAVIGNIKAGLNLYAANELVVNGSRVFPTAAEFVTATGFSDILDETPEGWTVADDASTHADSCYFIYQAADAANKSTYAYYGPSGGASYSISTYLTNP